jgi:mortality factor 4-like protein 1
VRTSEQDNVQEYKAHYKGWNKSWDEWVRNDRIIPNDDDGMRIKRQIDDDTPQTPSTKKRIRENEEGSDNEMFSPDSIKSNTKSKIIVDLSLPNLLQTDLIQDFRYIHDQKQVYKLPRPQTIESLLNQFLEEIKGEQEVKNDSLTNQEYELYEFVVNGIRTYFNATLSALLLYNNERQQYAHERKSNKKPDTIYGYEHLLRFFVKLPTLMQDTGMSQEAADIIQDRVKILFNFLEREHQKKL